MLKASWPDTWGEHVDRENHREVLAEIERYLDGLECLEINEVVEKWRDGAVDEEAVEAALDLLNRVVQAVAEGKVNKYQVFYETRLIYE